MCRFLAADSSGIEDIKCASIVMEADRLLASDPEHLDKFIHLWESRICA